MLEAFIHDPLISWRLLGAQEPGDERPSRRTSRPSSRPVLDESDHDEDEDEDDYDSYDSDETDDDDDDDEGDDTPDSSRPSSRHSLARSRRSADSRRSRRSSQRSREAMHHRMTRMANSLTTSTRYSGAAGRASRPDSVAASRLDHRSARESLRVRALGAADGADLPNGALNERALAVMARGNHSAFVLNVNRRRLRTSDRACREELSCRLISTQVMVQAKLALQRTCRTCALDHGNGEHPRTPTMGRRHRRRRCPFLNV